MQFSSNGWKWIFLEVLVDISRRCADLMVSTPKNPGVSPCWGDSVVLLDKALYSYGASLLLSV